VKHCQSEEASAAESFYYFAWVDKTCHWSALAIVHFSHGGTEPLKMTRRPSVLTSTKFILKNLHTLNKYTKLRPGTIQNT